MSDINTTTVSYYIANNSSLLDTTLGEIISLKENGQLSKYKNDIMPLLQISDALDRKNYPFLMDKIEIVHNGSRKRASESEGSIDNNAKKSEDIIGAYYDIPVNGLSKESIDYLNQLIIPSNKRFEYIEKEGTTPHFKITMFNITKQTTIGEIRDYFLNIINRFPIQDVIGGIFYSEEEAREYLSEFLEKKVDEITEEEFNKYFISEREKFYNSKGEEEERVVFYDNISCNPERTKKAHLEYLKAVNNKRSKIRTEPAEG